MNSYRFFSGLSGEINLQKSEIDLAKLIGRIVEETNLPENVRLEVHVGVGLERVSLDAGLVRRVLDNLVSNAAEAMPEGGTLTVRARRSDQGTLIEVEDTGTGIPEEAISHIFEPLYTTKTKGLGLGLAFVKRIVEAHGGTLTFVTKEGVGTKFLISLPIVREV